MATSGDDLEAEIDAWVEEHIARSPAWTPEKWASILSILGDERVEPPAGS